MSSLVPDGWSEEYISEYFDFSIGGTPSRNNELYWDANQTTSNIWVSIKDLKDKFISNSAERISDLGVSKSNVKLLPKNTVLMSFKLSIGRLAISTTPLYTNEAIVGFIEKRPNTVDRDYLYYGLQSWNLLGEVDQAVKGATLNKDKMSRILGVFPPLPEQKKIASILTSVDEVIENTQKQIDKLQDLKKATMNELLTKGIGHTEFKDSELGRIPKSWEIQRISELSSLVTNGFVGSASSHYRETGIPYLVSKNIRDNFIDERGLTYISREFHEKTSKSKLVQGDLLTVQSGHVGSSAVVTGEYDGANCHALILTRFNSNLVDSNFMAYYLNSTLGRLRLSIYFVGSTIVHLNTSDLKKFAVPVPPLKEQENIVSIVDSIQNQIDDQFSKLHQTQSLKKSLMQDLLTGKVRVTVN